MLRAASLVMVLLASSGEQRVERTGGRKEVRYGDRATSALDKSAAGGAGGGGGSRSIENAIIAGDEVGNWWALKADGTMLSGSSLTMDAIGSPTTSPIVLDGSTQWFVSHTSPTLPTGDFSFVCSANFATLGFATAAEVLGKYGSSAPSQAWLFEVAATTGLPTFYVITAGGTVTNANSQAFTVGAWQAIAGTWDNTAHASTLRMAGVTTSASGSAAIQTPGQPTVFGALNNAGQFPSPISSGGCFFTETKLSTTRQDAIMAGVL